jgi:hypothetical protein
MNHTPPEAQMQSAEGKVCAPAVFSVFPFPVPGASSVVSPLPPVPHVLPSPPVSCVVLAPPLPSSLLPLHPALQGFQIWHECSMAWQILIEKVKYLMKRGSQYMDTF